jgi:hypothetical protein
MAHHPAREIDLCHLRDPAAFCCAAHTRHLALADPQRACPAK